MTEKRREVSYYPEIMSAIKEQIESNFRSAERKLHVFTCIGELSAGLRKLVNDHPDTCSCVRDFADRVPPLSLDIFALITNGIKYELLILEVKVGKSAGLSEWSQLLGYCVVSNAEYGLLVNINNGASSRLQNLLRNEPHVSQIVRDVSGEMVTHKLGFLEWNSNTVNFEYSNMGKIRSISALCESIAEKFE